LLIDGVGFLQQCTRYPDTNRLDMKNVVNRSNPRLARYESPQNGKTELTEAWTEAFTKDHKDPDTSFSHVIDVIKPLSKGSQPGVAPTEEKVELWQYNSSLEFKPGEKVVSHNPLH
jgi:hypothetical protein